MSWIGPAAADLPNRGLDKNANLSDLVNTDVGRANIDAQKRGDVRCNLITNPCMQLSQENGDTAGTISGHYMADEWSVSFSTSAGAISAQRIQSTTSAGALNRIRVSITTADTSLAVDEYLGFRHTIEGSKFAAARWGTSDAKDVVVRFMGNFPAGTYAVSLRNAAADRSFVREITAVAGVDTVYEVTFPGDTSGTWPTGDVAGVVLWVCLASGTTYQTTADAWQSGNYVGTSSTSNGLGAVQSFDIGDVGMKIDPDSTGVYGQFEVPDPAQNELDCMRYYQKVYAYTIGPAQVNGVSNGGHILFRPMMRDIPSVSASAVSNSRAGTTTYLSITKEKMYYYAATSSATSTGSSQVFVDAWANARM